MAGSRRETIFALATGTARAAIAVFRVSGPGVRRAIETLTRAPIPAARKAVLRPLMDSGGERIDEAMVLFFAGPESFTGEDVVELHVHGGRAVAARLSDALVSIG
ncbi:MAG: tRNA uridine-5-carboxymethylaminomethyl(34) synthesis GTPase MnmE, partial [Alphaproteobacteria bacterium]|nr:tRNA uridine-5-carboxymethylaminomethyl(34) synthesis GTPase MnmE [Alphaproteobacteria bacterium]